MSLIARIVAICSAPLLCLVLEPPLSHGQTPRLLADEVREFEILVQGKPVGQGLIRITESNNDVTVVFTSVAVKFDFIVYVYHYELHATETWQGDRLVAVDDRAIDNGKKLMVRANVDSQGSIIQANGKSAARGPVLDMTTNYWRSPDSLRGGVLSFLDVNRGNVHSAKMEYVGPNQIMVAGDTLGCTHYRLRGSVAADLWFDGQRRLVRQQTVEQGYPIEVRLVRLTTHSAPIAVVRERP